MNRLRFGLLLGIAGASLLGACATRPGHGEVVRSLEKAERAYDAKDWRIAEQGYRELMQQVPQDAYAYFRLGNTLARQMRLDEAVEAYRGALARDPEMARAYSNLAMVRLLQAELALDAAVGKGQSRDTSVAGAQKMLKDLQKLTNIPVQEVQPPLAARGNNYPPTTRSAEP